jgi:hypothetical protein
MKAHGRRPAPSQGFRPRSPSLSAQLVRSSLSVLWSHSLPVSLQYATLSSSCPRDNQHLHSRAPTITPHSYHEPSPALNPNLRPSVSGITHVSTCEDSTNGNPNIGPPPLVRVVTQCHRGVLKPRSVGFPDTYTHVICAMTRLATRLPFL